MILYSLLCDKDHEFEVWFKSSGDFDIQSEKGYISCPVCGSSSISKSLMAPSVSTSKRKQMQVAPHEDFGGMPAGPAATPPEGSSAQMALASPDPKMAALLDVMRKLKNHITENADYVGQDFAEEARKIHYGETEERGIYGETTPKEAESLLEEGIEIQPLPVLPDETN